MTDSLTSIKDSPTSIKDSLMSIKDFLMSIKDWVRYIHNPSNKPMTDAKLLQIIKQAARKGATELGISGNELKVESAILMI